MIISSADFLVSNSDYKKCPKPAFPEYAFIGRSNVGKSSLINMLTNRGNLAKTSVKPGKTQLINHFFINKSWYLVDLPGYGYAKVSKTKKAEFQQLIIDYVKLRENLLCLFVLIDSRLEPQKIDLEFIEWCGENEIPFSIVFTKTDKIGKVQVQKNTALFEKTLALQFDELPNLFLTSSEKKQGAEDIYQLIEETNQLFFAQRNNTPKEIIKEETKDSDLTSED